MPQSHLCFQFRSSVFWDPDAWHPVTRLFVCLFGVVFVFHISHQVYLTSVNHRWSPCIQMGGWSVQHCQKKRGSRVSTAPPIFHFGGGGEHWIAQRVDCFVLTLRLIYNLDALDHWGEFVFQNSSWLRGGALDLSLKSVLQWSDMNYYHLYTRLQSTKCKKANKQTKKRTNL